MSKTAAIKAISLLWIGSLAGAGLAFLTQIILARTLGAEGFGVFSSALTTVTLAAPIAGLGVAQFWIKAFGEEGWQATRWLKSSFMLTTTSTVISCTALITWALLGPNESVMQFTIIVLSTYLISQTASDLVSSQLQLEERYKFLAIWQFSPHLLRLILISGLSISANIISIETATISYAITSAIVVSASIFKLKQMQTDKFFLKGHPPRKNTSPTMASTWDITSQTWPFGIAALFQIIYFQSDIVLLKYISGNSAAGHYSIAATIITATLLLPGAIYQKFLLPKIHRWANSDRSLFHEAYKKGNFFMFFAGLACMILIMTASPTVLPLLFGEQYLESITPLLILAIALPMMFMIYSAGAPLSTKNNIKTKAAAMGAAAAINIALNIILIPTLGMAGAAISTVVSYALLLATYVWLYQKIIRHQI